MPVPHGVQVVDGADEARKSRARADFSYGADWIKVYSDRSYSVREDGVLDDIPTFTLEELKAIVDEAHRERHKVASHAMACRACTIPSKPASIRSSTEITSRTKT